MGHGYIFADWILAIIVTLCALAHLAVLRAPDIPESKIIEHIRWIKIAGFSILAIRFWFVISTHGDLYIPPATEIGLTLIFGAELYRTVYRLFQELMDHQYSSRAQRKGRIHAD
jgi:hypothetical protein